MEYKDHRLAAVMFTDIVGFSRMMEEDEKGTLQTLDFHNTLVREQVTRFRGSVIKTIGDAFLAQFNTALDAVQCSLAVQEAIAEYNKAGLGKALTLRIGVHLGDIYFSENDALGEGINIASRLQSLTKPGRITISREVYGQVSGKVPMRVEALGQVQLKNITREVHAYEILPGAEDNDSSAFRQGRAASQGGGSAPPSPASSSASTGPNVVPPPEPKPAPPPSGTDLRHEWRHLRSQVGHFDRHALRDQIREQVRASIDASRSAYASRQGSLDPASMVGQFFHDPLDDLKRDDGTPASAFQIYKQKRLRQAKKAQGGFAGHLVPYVSVNAFLAFLYFSVSPGAHPWFLYPLFGWGIGIVSHWTGVKALRSTARELESLDDASEEDLAVIKRFQDSRAGFSAHAGSNVAVAALLTMIWVINGGGFPWPLIPIGAMAIGVFSHLSGFVARRAEFRGLWRTLVPSRGRRGKTPVVAPESDPLVAKARALRDSVVAQAQAMKGGNPFGEDMTTTLDNYVLQIAELSTIEKELGRVVATFRPADLDAELLSVRTKVASTSSAALKQEYEKSLASLEKQKKSFEDLGEQQEILNLRIKGALGNLQQMQVDLARIKGLSDGQKGGAFVSIKERSEELSRYIEDYREGLKELPE